MHVQKFKDSQKRYMFNHYDRSANNIGTHIDRTKTHLNINFNSSNLTQNEKFKRRTDKVKKLNRSDVNVICTCIVTLPKNVEISQSREFFKQAYTFLSQRYGEDNVVSSYAHYDEPEARPHMHFCWIPIVKDKKHTDREKICAKEVVTRDDLSTLHTDFESYLRERNIGGEIIKKEKASKSNLTLLELKKRTLLDEMEAYKGISHELDELMRIDRERGERVR